MRAESYFVCFLVQIIIGVCLCFNNCDASVDADINGDGIIDLKDMSLFAEHWLEQGCLLPDWCSGADLNYGTKVNFSEQSRNWRQGIEILIVGTTLQIKSQQSELDVSLMCPAIEVDDMNVRNIPPLAITGNVQAGELTEITYDTIDIGDGDRIEVKMYLQWFADEGVLRKWISYCMQGTSSDRLIKEIILDSFDESRLIKEFVPSPPQNCPAFVKTWLKDYN